MAQQQHFGEQFQQLPMFMTVGELKSIPSVDAPGARPDSYEHRSMWNEKSAESRGRGLKMHIERNGLQNPVSVLHEFTDYDGHVPGISHGNGHHRTASMGMIHGKDALVPVLHADGSDGNLGFTRNMR